MLNHRKFNYWSYFVKYILKASFAYLNSVNLQLHHPSLITYYNLLLQVQSSSGTTRLAAENYNKMCNPLQHHLQAHFLKLPAFPLLFLWVYRSQFSSKLFRKWISQRFHSLISLNLNGFCHTVTRSLETPERNHGWPWLHRTRHNILEQVASKKTICYKHADNSLPSTFWVMLPPLLYCRCTTV